MRLERHGALRLEQLEKLDDQRDGVLVLLLVVRGTRQAFADATAHTLQDFQTVADHHCTDPRAQDDSHFGGCSFDDRPHGAVVQDVETEYAAKKDYQTYDDEHLGISCRFSG